MTGLRKRSVRVAGHPTSVSLEDAFWQALGDIAVSRDMTLTAVIDEIDTRRGGAGLSSAIRLYVLDWYRDEASQGG